MMNSRICWSLFAAVIALSGCDGGTSTVPRSSISLSFSSRDPAASAFSAVQSALPPDTMRSGSNVLIVDKVEIVLKQIELKSVSVADCDLVPQPAGCTDFKTDPLVLDLPLGIGAQQLIAVDIPPGTYSKVEFEIHKLSSGDTRSAALRAARPDLVDRSIRVVGKFNGTAFIFESDLDVEQELTLAPPMVINSTTSTNLTIRFTIANWFRTQAGALVSPMTANKGGANESLVKENIKSSMKAFKDDDRDGDDRDG